MTLTVDQVFNNRYRIDKILSHDEVGAVYQGRDMSLGVTVIIKENVDTSPEARRRSKQEANQLMRLLHPNLPRFSDYIFIPRQAHYLVMQYIEGETLQYKLDKRVSLTEVEVLAWFTQLCNAVAYLHHQNVSLIHGCIGLHNVVIQPDGRPVLVGGGIAKLYHPDLRAQLATGLLKTGYSAPELYRNQLPSPATDQYALAAALYHALVKQRPSPAVERVYEDAPIRFPAQAALVSPLVQQTIQKGMSLTSEERYSTVNQFRGALEESLEGASTYRDALYVFPSSITTYLTGLMILVLFACGLLSFTSLIAESNLTLPAAIVGEATPPTATPVPTVVATPRGTPTAVIMQPFKSVPLGLSLTYPDLWRREESSLEVRFSPSVEGLRPQNLTDMSIWLGLSPIEQTTPGDILTNLVSDFPDEAELLSEQPLGISGQDWRSVQIQFETADGGGMAVFAATVKEEVGYFVVVSSRLDQWDIARPLFQQLVSSIEFTKEAEVRFLSEDELPPTPTPTPTPIIYIVQPGDSYGRISALYDIDMEVLLEENDLRISDILRVGQEVVIPRGYD